MTKIERRPDDVLSSTFSSFSFFLLICFSLLFSLHRLHQRRRRRQRPLSAIVLPKLLARVEHTATVIDRERAKDSG